MTRNSQVRQAHIRLLVCVVQCHSHALQFSTASTFSNTCNEYQPATQVRAMSSPVACLRVQHPRQDQRSEFNGHGMSGPSLGYPTLCHKVCWLQLLPWPHLPGSVHCIVPMKSIAMHSSPTPLLAKQMQQAPTTQTASTRISYGLNAQPGSVTLLHCRNHSWVTRSQVTLMACKI